MRLGFIWDDHFTIQGNSTLQSWSWAHVQHDFQTGLFDDSHGSDFYRPLIALANRVDYSLYGGRPWGYHLSNLLFHILNSLLAMVLILRLGFSRMTAFLTACFFAVHPINVQDMVMVTGRCGLLGMLFSLLALLFLLQPNDWIVTAGLAYACALFAKESAFAVPLFYLAIVWLQRTWSLRDVLNRLRLLTGIERILSFTAASDRSSMA